MWMCENGVLFFNILVVFLLVIELFLNGFINVVLMEFMGENIRFSVK